MGCGCKKRQESIQQQVVNQQTQPVNVTISEGNNPQVQLTPEQQAQVNKIISKIDEINNNTNNQ